MQNQPVLAELCALSSAIKVTLSSGCGQQKGLKLIGRRCIEFAVFELQTESANLKHCMLEADLFLMNQVDLEVLHAGSTGAVGTRGQMDAIPDIDAWGAAGMIGTLVRPADRPVS